MLKGRQRSEAISREVIYLCFRMLVWYQVMHLAKRDTRDVKRNEVMIPVSWMMDSIPNTLSLFSLVSRVRLSKQEAGPSTTTVARPYQHLEMQRW